jgi:transposase
VIIWHLLTGNQPYSDLGGDYFVRRHHREADKNRLIRQLERMRYKVTVEPLNPA